MVAKQLDTRLRDSLRGRGSLFADPLSAAGRSDTAPAQLTASFQRPLLAILDRGIDLAAPLHHSWTYQALAHDLLDYSVPGRSYLCQCFRLPLRFQSLRADESRQDHWRGQKAPNMRPRQGLLTSDLLYPYFADPLAPIPPTR